MRESHSTYRLVQHLTHHLFRWYLPLGSSLSHWMHEKRLLGIAVCKNVQAVDFNTESDKLSMAHYWTNRLLGHLLAVRCRIFVFIRGACCLMRGGVLARYLFVDRTKLLGNSQAGKEVLSKFFGWNIFRIHRTSCWQTYFGKPFGWRAWNVLSKSM